MEVVNNEIKGFNVKGNEEEKGISLLPFTFGLASITGQVALLREFMSLFSGHEIIIGVFLAAWMLLTGVGAFAGRKLKVISNIALLPVVLGVAFVFSVLVLYLMRSFFVVHGAEPEFITLVSIIVFSLIPVCLTSGYAFTHFSQDAFADEGNWSISKVYVWEQLGSSVGGGLLYLILVQRLDSIRILIVIISVLFIVSVLVSAMTKEKKVFSIVGVVVLMATLLVIPVQKYLRSLDLRSEKIVSISDTPYGNVIVTENGDQTNVYENGDLRSYTGDVEVVEEDVHSVMLRHPSPHKVLMIGGASPGTFKEFEKYKDVNVDYVDIDPAIIELLKKSRSPNVNFYVTDPFRFLNNTNSKYDVIILNTGVPHNLQDNRFYTKEFFSAAQSKLNKGGVVGVKGPEKQFHHENSYVRFLSTIASTGKSVFENYDVFPGNNVWFIFSDEKILPVFNSFHTDVTAKNIWFNSDYILPDLMDEEREGYIKEINLNMAVNSSLRPVLLEQSISEKTSYWHIDRYFYLYFIAGIFIALLFAVSRRGKIMAIAGFSLSGVQILLIYLMQIVAGNIYEVIGVLFALSMGGMALGGWLHRKFIFDFNIKSNIFLFATGVFILLLPFVQKELVTGSLWYYLQVAAVYFLVLLFSFAGGVLFSSVSYDEEASTAKSAGAVYGADLFGSSAGVLLTSLFFIPVAGMENTAFLLGIICVIAGLLLIRN
ncbi:MAG: hypothetical protein GXO47_13250 [Chlorobi bacterium]|nr:hypothetical protein [Chlorobiota bacterium]